jgi:hypothetical protein
MEQFFAKVLRRFAPRTADAITSLVAANEDSGGLIPHVLSYEQQVRELRAEIDELRADSRKIAELYDLVFERLDGRL